MHPAETSTQAIRRVAELISAARHPVVLSGAGLSAESGIPTYRGPDGIWTKFGEPTFDGWELFLDNPAHWWEEALRARDQRSEFQAALDAAVPNPGHVALADLERVGRVGHVITQNVDNLHRSAGSFAVTEIHGNRHLARCMHCGKREHLLAIPKDPLPPLCLECGGIMKTDVVMFGEPIPQDALEESYRQTFRADLFLTIGTSAVVYPAAEFPLLAKRHGTPLIEINPERTDLSDYADLVVRAPAGEALPEIARLVRA